MNGFERRKEQTREHIRSVAYELFNKRGTLKVSINDIARQAGVSPASIYNHYSNKDELVFEWANHTIGHFFQHIRTVSMSKLPFPEKLEKMVSEVLLMLEESQHLYFNEDDIRKNPMLRQLVEGSIEQQVRIFVDLAEEGRKLGYVSKDITNESVRYFIQIAMAGIRADPDIHARLHSDIPLTKGLMSLWMFGFLGSKRK